MSSWLNVFLVPACGFLVFHMLPMWMAMLLASCVTLHAYYNMTFSEFRKSFIQGPFPVPVLGTLWQVYHKGVRQSDIDNIARYGAVVGTYEGRTPTLLISDPDLLKQVMIKDFQCFTNRRGNGLAEYPIRRALTELRGDHWKHVRCKLTPFFTSAKLKGITERIHVCAFTLVANLKTTARQGQPIGVKRYCGAFAMDTIASTAFDLDLDSQNDPANPFVKYAEKVFNISIPQPLIILLLLFPWCLGFIKKLGFLFFPADAREFFVNVIDIALERRAKNHKPHEDFLQMMLNMRVPLDAVKVMNGHNPDGFVYGPDGLYTPKGLTHEEVLAQSLLFFVAGYETTATALAMTLYNLATNPEWQDRIRLEIEGMNAEEEHCNLEHLRELKVLDACIQETLRLYPAATRVTRVCGRDTYLGPHPVTRGTVVAIPIYALHHDPDIWEQPEEFRPQRFMGMRPPPFLYMPFGAGPRGCLGVRLALLELKVAVVHVLRHFRVCTCSLTQIPVRLSRRVILQPEQDIVLRFVPMDEVG